MPVLDLALFVPRRDVGAYASFKKLASGVDYFLSMSESLIGEHGSKGLLIKRLSAM
jgi:hypothetical protein